MKKSEKRLKLDLDDRMTIQGCLHRKDSIIQIAKILKVHRSTIYREISRNLKSSAAQIYKFDNCATRNKLIVCNTCQKKGYCKINKFYYDFRYAQTLTDNRRKTSRSNPKLPVNDIKIIDEIVTSGVNLGQSLHHIYVSNPILKDLCCEKTIRRLVYRGNLSIRPHQLRRYVVYKKEYKNNNIGLQRIDIKALVGRTFKDYNRFTSANKSKNTVQYYSVIGKKTDRQAILTITFPKYNFQFGLLIKKGSSSSVTKSLSGLFKRIGIENTKKIFAFNICDNGTEFTSFYKLEFDDNGEQRFKTFYTNPYRFTNKAQCEKNHVLLGIAFLKESH